MHFLYLATNSSQSGDSLPFNNMHLSRASFSSRHTQQGFGFPKRTYMLVSYLKKAHMANRLKYTFTNLTYRHLSSCRTSCHHTSSCHTSSCHTSHACYSDICLSYHFPTRTTLCIICNANIVLPVRTRKKMTAMLSLSPGRNIYSYVSIIIQFL